MLEYYCIMIRSLWTLVLIVQSLPGITRSSNADLLMSDSIAKHADQHPQVIGVSPNNISIALVKRQSAL